jgi:hypothetical protein
VSRWGLALGLGLALGAGPAAFGAGKAPRPIGIEDLRPTIQSITIGSIRKNESNITERAFRKKLDSALKSPLHLKQTFPGLLGRLVKPLIGTRALPGKRGAVGFDAHIENTGAIKLGKNRLGRQRSIDAIVDVDDSGFGPAGVDALSIGTALVQAGVGKKTLRKAAEAFAEAAKGRASSPSEVEGPKWGQMRKRWLAKNTREEKRQGEQVLSFKGHGRAPPKAYAVIEQAAKANAVLHGYDVLDIAEAGKSTGGSGGVKEYRLLARKKENGKVHVFLMKEQKTPGAHDLGVPQPAVDDRIKVLGKDLWGDDVPEDVFFYMHDVKLEGRSINFLVRNEFSLKSQAVTRSNKQEMALRAARVYGRAHAGDFGELSAEQIADWMEESTHALVKGFGELRHKLHAKSKDHRN